MKLQVEKVHPIVLGNNHQLQENMIINQENSLNLPKRLKRLMDNLQNLVVK